MGWTSQSLGVGGSACGLERRRSGWCVSFWCVLRHEQQVVKEEGVSQGGECVPFSHLWRRRLPSLPFSSASRLFRLSRRTGSVRLYTVCTCAVVAGRAGALSSSSGMSKTTEVPVTAAGAGAEMATEPMAAVACSVHASMSMGCGAAAWGEEVVKSSMAMVAVR